MLYQTKRSESYPRILSLRNESRVSSLPCHPEPILRGISSPLCHPERSEGSPLPSVIPNEVRGLLFSLLQLHPKTTLCLWGKFERGQFPLSIEQGVSSPPCHPEPHLRWVSSLPRHPERSEESPTLEVLNVPHPCL